MVIGSVFKSGKKYYPKTFSGECNYKLKEEKAGKRFITKIFT